MSEPAPLLLTPGPGRVPERVLQAGAHPMMHHRSPEFSRVLAEVVGGLRPLFGTTGDVLPVHTTGRGAMEAAVCNLFSAGDELIACCNGKFGEMWATFAASYGITVHRIATDWERNLDPEDVADALERYPLARSVTLVHSDTSTGALNDVAGVSAVCRERGALVLVDAVSSLGGVPFDLDGWGVDVAVTASQKCLMCSPGLAFVAVSQRAWAARDRARLPRNYLDFGAIRETLAGPHPQTPGTTPVHLVLQVREALRMILEEGMEAVFQRHLALAKKTRNTLADLGLDLQGTDIAERSPTLTAVSTAGDLDPAAVRAAMRDRGYLLAAGLGPYRPTVFRIGHMGDIRHHDLERALTELREVVEALRGTPGTSTAAGAFPRSSPSIPSGRARAPGGTSAPAGSGPAGPSSPPGEPRRAGRS